MVVKNQAEIEEGMVPGIVGPSLSHILGTITLEEIQNHGTFNTLAGTMNIHTLQPPSIFTVPFSTCDSNHINTLQNMTQGASLDTRPTTPLLFIIDAYSSRKAE